MLCKCCQEDEAQENKVKMKMVEKNMEQQKENMEHLKSLKVEAENKYDEIKQKINQLSEQADPLKVYIVILIYVCVCVCVYLFIFQFYVCSIPARRAFLVTQLVKNLPAMQETPVRFLGWEDPLEKG